MKILNKGFVFSLFVFYGMLILSCNKTDKSVNSDDPEADDSTGTEQASFTKIYDFSNYESYQFERVPVVHTINPINEALPKLPFSTNAHRQYLNENLVFNSIPDGGIPDELTAVVGTDDCFFYPVKNISSEAELDSLPKGEIIPFATIIPLGNKLESGIDMHEGLFEFQDNYNYFYQTTWNGKQGIVFGADLFGIDDTNFQNKINSLLYKGNGYFDSFYPAAGYIELKTGIQRELEVNGLAFQEVKKSEYRLDVTMPDDMISLYQAINKKVTPVFVTTDLAAHANHLVFDRMLQYLEEEYFFPQLVRLVNEYITAIENQKDGISDEVYNTSLLYFQTAEALLALAPKKVKGTDYNSTIEYIDVNASQVLASYPRQVVDEISKMDRAEAGMVQSSVFSAVKEDYSQYKVRGHYTKNGVLGAYFRAMMWFGRINFNLGGDNEIAKKLAPVSLFITDITENSPQIKRIWQSLFDSITDLIGASDDISFHELIPLWERIKGAGFVQWYNDSKKLDAFVTTEYKELRAPAISGSSVFDGGLFTGNSENLLPPTGWRLFGQRYTLDNEIHTLVSSPRLYGRTMVKGLDIFRVFGSKTADRFLRESDYRQWPNLEKTLNQLQQNLGSIKDDYWLSTYYTNILYQIKTLALFDNGAGFYFSEKPGWSLKAMNAAHGTWAELRHDTILYVKQSYAEKGGGDWDPTFRTKPLPEPVHYIEPNVPFWITSALGMQKMYSILKKYDCLDGITAQVLTGMYEIFVKAAEISRLEADDKPVSNQDLAWIKGVPNLLASLVLVHATNSVGPYVEDPDTFRMALIADVFTDAESGKVLETAVGIPYRLLIPLNDKQGGKRIALGYGFSYYEFVSDAGRYNNEEWKEIVYKENQNMNKYLPFWMQGKIQATR
jgi:hypothetical protein